MRCPLLFLVLIAITGPAFAKAPRTVDLSEADVAIVNTSVGYTTMLQFDSRPTSAVLGDQDAFKVEYTGTGLAIKPLVPRARTNLFVFTDYDRFNFRLVTGAPDQAEYVLRVKRKVTVQVPSQAPAKAEDSSAVPLLQKRIGRKAVCGTVSLAIQAIAWPRSQSTLLVQFRAEVSSDEVAGKDLRFEPGDFEIAQAGRMIPIESLHLDRLLFKKDARGVEGTAVLRNSDLQAGVPLEMGFYPDFHRKAHPGCPKVIFSTQTRRALKKHSTT
ncbi:MAG TPA: TrbG/VirB9 family P-type conjugative transfer protein [Bdellovibrionota bacterium]|nr:TrbG/VirB9 family P-type conjugative transfer protein [Bdellovibrionota bacterium]